MSFKIMCLMLSVCLNTKAQSFFAALSKMEPLIKTQVQVVQNIEPYIYIINDKHKREHLQRFVNHCKSEHDKAERDVEHYLGNPLNSFTLIKRLTSDLQCIEDILSRSTGYRRNYKLKYPNEEDLIGALEGIVSLQVFYQLRIPHLANGTLIGNISRTREPFVEYVAPLSASDCFHLGKVEYENKDFSKKVAWMKEALKKYRAGSTMCDYKLVDIYDQISEGYYEMGKFDDCLQWVKKRVALSPIGHHTADYRTFIDHLKLKIAEQRRNAMKDIGNWNTTRTEPTSYVEINQSNDEALCAGETNLFTSNRRLKCYYARGPHPYLKLARIQSEQLHLTPDVTMYHQIISDDEIKVIQLLAKPRLKRATVTNTETGEIKNSVDYRITEVAWLSGDNSEVVERVTRRVNQVTGLTVEGDEAEDLQVANYGIAGCYLPHYDFTGDITKRMASFMFYMTDVEQGGATTFLKLGLTVFPIKNAGVFWKNYQPSGEKDMDTIHSACPILRGSKWVAIKWISLAGQELINPCPTNFKPPYQALSLET